MKVELVRCDLETSRCDWSAVPACVSVYYFGACVCACYVVDALAGVDFMSTVGCGTVLARSRESQLPDGFAGYY